jgi:hypothetical protein
MVLVSHVLSEEVMAVKVRKGPFGSTRLKRDSYFLMVFGWN